MALADVEMIAAFKRRVAAEGVAATVLRTPAQDAIAAFAQLQTQLTATTNAIQTVNLGPFQLGGSCDYDCFIGICIHTQNWSWTLDFDSIRGPLQGAVRQVRGAAGQYDQAFGPARDWLKTTLPQFSSTFAAQAQAILSTNAAIMSAGGKATPAQIQTVSQAFQAISSGLTAGHAAMDGAAGAVAQFTNVLQAVEGNVSSLLSNMQSSINTGVKNAQDNLINQLNCGQGDADNQINGAIAMFNVSVSVIQNNLGAVNGVTQTLTNALKEFVGTLVNISDQYTNVEQQIGQAQGFPAGAIQDLHLDIAASEWQQLAQYASQNIQ
jgi:hypothetical protein